MLVDIEQERLQALVTKSVPSENQGDHVNDVVLIEQLLEVLSVVLGEIDQDELVPLPVEGFEFQKFRAVFLV